MHSWSPWLNHICDFQLPTQALCQRQSVKHSATACITASPGMRSSFRLSHALRFHATNTLYLQCVCVVMHISTRTIHHHTRAIYDAHSATKCTVNDSRCRRPRDCVACSSYTPCGYMNASSRASFLWFRESCGHKDIQCSFVYVMLVCSKQCMRIFLNG